MSALGTFAEGRRYGEEALRLATLDGRGDTPIMVHTHLGLLYLAKGDLEHAIRVLEQGLDRCRASGNRTELRGIADEAAGPGTRRALHGHRPLPRYGDDLLAPRGGGGIGGGRKR